MDICIIYNAKDASARALLITESAHFEQRSSPQIYRTPRIFVSPCHSRVFYFL